MHVCRLNVLALNSLVSNFFRTDIVHIVRFCVHTESIKIAVCFLGLEGAMPIVGLKASVVNDPRCKRTPEIKRKEITGSI